LRHSLLQEFAIAAPELDVAAVIPAGEDVFGGVGHVIAEQVGVAVQALGRAGGNFGFVKAIGDAQRARREAVIIPADRSDKGDLARDERFRFQPLPAERADAGGE